MFDLKKITPVLWHYPPRNWWVDGPDGALRICVRHFEVPDIDTAKRILSKLDMILEEEGL